MLSDVSPHHCIQGALSPQVNGMVYVPKATEMLFPQRYMEFTWSFALRRSKWEMAPNRFMYLKDWCPVGRAVWVGEVLRRWSLTGGSTPVGMGIENSFCPHLVHSLCLVFVSQICPLTSCCHASPPSWTSLFFWTLKPK